MSRKKTLHRIFDSVRSRLPAGFGFKQFTASFDGWEVVPLMRGDELIGGALVHENELHVGYAIPPGASLRHHMKKVFPMVRKPMKTAVSVDNAAGLLFCARLGFKEVGRANGIIFLRCEKPNYV